MYNIYVKREGRYFFNYWKNNWKSQKAEVAIYLFTDSASEIGLYVK